MRMWGDSTRGIPVDKLCRKHLLGEHGEIHKHRHNFVKKHNMSGRIGQIFPLHMKNRHDQLAAEMTRRGYKHNSPYKQPDVSYLPFEMLLCPVNTKGNIKDLCNRCKECKRLIKGEQWEI